MNSKRPSGVTSGSRLEKAFQPARFSLKTRLIAVLLLLAWLPLLIALPLQYRLIDRNLGEHAVVELEQIAAVQQRRVNRELERMLHSLALIASRTQMRISVDAFAATGAEEHQEFVAQILADAAESAENLIGGWVYDTEDTLVAVVGPVSAFPASDIFEELPGSNGNRIGPHWVEDDCEKLIWVGTDLELDERVIGRLVLAMDTAPLQDLLDDFPHPRVIGQSHIILERSDGVRCVLSSTPSEEFLDDRSFLSVDKVLEVTAQMPAGEKAVASYESDRSALIGMPLALESSRLLIHSVPHLQSELRAIMLAGYGAIVLLLLILGGLLSVWLSGWISAPLAQLTKAVDRVREGGDMPEIELRRWPRELLLLAEILRTTMDSQRRFESALRSEIRQRRAAQNRLLDLANTDELTGLANRRHFMKRLEDQVANPVAHAALLYMDLDRFKPVNDEHGHAVGDEVLKAVGERLINAIREHDLPARLGGDEFAVLLIEDEHAPDVEPIAERIEASIMQPISVGGITVQVGCSIGKVALVPGLGMHDALRRADEAMYSVKQAKRTRDGK